MMMRSMKTALILLGLVLLAGLVVVGVRSQGPDAGIAASEPVTASGAETLQASPGPSFEVRVIRPRTALPLGGILPARLFGVLPLQFDDASPGAGVGSVGLDHLSLLADGWDLLIQTDGEGRVAAGTRLVFSLHLAERDQNLRCWPGEPAEGYLHTTPEAGGALLGGELLVKLVTCENLETGKTINWPPAPLTVTGSFGRLPISAG